MCEEMAQLTERGGRVMKNCTGIRCIMQLGKVDPATCPAVGYCQQATPPTTNADRIRAMSDKELEEWYWWMHKEMMNYTDSHIFFRDWLRQ